MNVWDALILLAVVGLLFLALRSVRKSGSGCASCRKKDCACCRHGKDRADGQ